MVAHYNSPDDLEKFVTPSQLKRLGREKQVAYIAHWFNGMFEDPQNETPYADKESPYNYNYIWGGPYDARDEIETEFSGVVSEEVIQAAIDEVESDGITEWAPGPYHPDKKAREEEALTDQYEDPSPSLFDVPSITLDQIRQRLESGVEPNFGGQVERAERQTLRDEIAKLRELLEVTKLPHGGIGHNKPPNDLEIEADKATDLAEDIEVVDQELAKPIPELPKVIENLGRLQRLIAWGASKLELTFDAFLKGVGGLVAIGTVGKLTYGDWGAVWIKIGEVFEIALRWLNTVTMPF